MNKPSPQLLIRRQFKTEETQEAIPEKRLSKKGKEKNRKRNRHKDGGVKGKILREVPFFPRGTRKATRGERGTKLEKRDSILPL